MVFIDQFDKPDAQGIDLVGLLQRPEIMALAQGLLQGSAPNMNQPVTFGSAFGQGLGAYNQARGDEADRAMKNKWLNLSLEQNMRARHKEKRLLGNEVNRKKYAQFIKQFPQYSKDSPEDILAIIEKLEQIEAAQKGVK